MKKKKKNPGKIRKALQENWQSVSQPFHYSEWLAHFPKERKKKNVPGVSDENEQPPALNVLDSKGR